MCLPKCFSFNFDFCPLVSEMWPTWDNVDGSKVPNMAREPTFTTAKYGHKSFAIKAQMELVILDALSEYIGRVVIVFGMAVWLEDGVELPAVFSATCGCQWAMRVPVSPQHQPHKNQSSVIHWLCLMQGLVLSAFLFLS